MSHYYPELVNTLVNNTPSIPEVYNKSSASQVKMVSSLTRSGKMADSTVAPSINHKQRVDENLPAIKKN